MPHKVYLTDKVLPGSSVVSLKLQGIPLIKFHRGETGGTVSKPVDLTPAQVAELEEAGYKVKEVDEKPAGRKPVAAAAEEGNQAGDARKRRGETAKEE